VVHDVLWVVVKTGNIARGKARVRTVNLVGEAVVNIPVQLIVDLRFAYAVVVVKNGVDQPVGSVPRQRGEGPLHTHHGTHRTAAYTHPARYGGGRNHHVAPITGGGGEFLLVSALAHVQNIQRDDGGAVFPAPV
jgi:hypothetical protein